MMTVDRLAEVMPTVCGHHVWYLAPVLLDRAPHEHVVRLVGPVAERWTSLMMHIAIWRSASRCLLVLIYTDLQHSDAEPS
jgi:hypothetical protein